MTFVIHYEYANGVTTTDTIIARIRAYRAARDWAPSRLATEAGLSNMALRDMDAADWNPRAGTLRKLEALIPARWQPGQPVPTDKAA